MKSVKDANIQLKELFQNYKKFVSSNPQTISDLETTAKWISYFIAGKTSKFFNYLIEFQVHLIA